MGEPLAIAGLFFRVLFGAGQVAGRRLRLPWRRFLARIVELCLGAAAFGRTVRIGALMPKGKLSNTIIYIEPYYRKLVLDEARRPLLIVLNPGPDPNAQLTAMYRRVLWYFDRGAPLRLALFTWALRVLQQGGSPLAAMLGADKGTAREWDKGRPVVSFTPEEEARGRALLAELGIPEGAPFVCFGIREKAFYADYMNACRRQGRDPAVESRPEYDLLNPPLENYLLALNILAERGFYVLRMGSVPGASLPEAAHERIIDYAAGPRSPFGDIYLLSKCRFCLSGASGVSAVSTAFNLPTVLCDSYNLSFIPYRHDELFIPVRRWLQGEKRHLTFREMLEFGNTFSDGEVARRYGVELEPNSPQEIADVVEEMLARLDGSWRPEPDDEDLQRRYRDMFEPRHMGYPFRGRIGANYLRENAHLLYSRGKES